MKSFKDVRKKSDDSKNVLLQKKVDNVTVVVKKEEKGFTVYINGEILDTYRSADEAKQMGIAFAKELK